MEVAVVFNHADYEAYASRRKGGSKAVPDFPTGFVPGFAYSGTYAGRNIEAIYERAEEAGIDLSLEDALRACFEEPGAVRHVLLCSGFFVAHGMGGRKGSAETDGPLGALALLRAFALRGVRVSLFSDERTAPVIKASYDFLVDYARDLDAEVADLIVQNTRCMAPVSSRLSGSFRDGFELGAAHGAGNPECQQLPRSVAVASQLGVVLRDAWAGHWPGEVDCIFAVERLGQPYRNIRGRDISEYTAPVDCLWPLAEGAVSCVAEAEADAERVRTLRRLAGIRVNALSLGIGDGGNEVGMGKVALVPDIAALSPGGEFAALSVNGCSRTCDYLLLGTVSNWAGTAFEMASDVLFPLPVGSPSLVAALRRQGLRIADLEAGVLRHIMRAPVGAVDGKHPEKDFSVDGMSFEPYHRELCDLLWDLAVAEA